jgi:hypothetical protein
MERGCHGHRPAESGREVTPETRATAHNRTRPLVQRTVDGKLRGPGTQSHAPGPSGPSRSPSAVPGTYPPSPRRPRMTQRESVRPAPFPPPGLQVRPRPPQARQRQQFCPETSPRRADLGRSSLVPPCGNPDGSDSPPTCPFPSQSTTNTRCSFQRQRMRWHSPRTQRRNTRRHPSVWTHHPGLSTRSSKVSEPGPLPPKCCS